MIPLRVGINMKKVDFVGNVVKNCMGVEYRAVIKETREEVYFRSHSINKFPQENNGFNLRVSFMTELETVDQLLIMFHKNFTCACYRFDYYRKEHRKLYQTEIIVPKGKNSVLLRLEDCLEKVKIYLYD